MALARLALTLLLKTKLPPVRAPGQDRRGSWTDDDFNDAHCGGRCSPSDLSDAAVVSPGARRVVAAPSSARRRLKGMVVGATKSESSERARAKRVRPRSRPTLMAEPNLARFREYFPRCRTVRTLGEARV